MKLLLRLILPALLVIGVSLYYLDKYTYMKSGEDYRLYLNPFEPDQGTFDHHFDEAERKLSIHDTAAALEHYCKALEYRGSPNEKKRENIYSDANDYWSYKLDMLLKYATAYEMTGEPDSAISCLAPGLVSSEKYHYSIDKKFFSLFVRKYGRDQTVSLIARGLGLIRRLDCYHCYDYYFPLKDYKVGIDETAFEQAKTDREGLLRMLCAEYGI